MVSKDSKKSRPTIQSYSNLWKSVNGNARLRLCESKMKQNYQNPIQNEIKQRQLVRIDSKTVQWSA